MKSKMLAIFLISLCTTLGFAQTEGTENETLAQEVTKTFDIPKGGKIIVDLSQVNIQGYSGNQVILSSKIQPTQEDKRAKGLVQINGLGLIDNTGLGVNVTQENGTMTINQLAKIFPPNLIILVPEGIMIKYDHQSPHGSAILFENLNGELEISSNYNSIKLKDVTGPLALKTIHGNVDAVFKEKINGPISIISYYGYIDASIPSTTPANLKLATKYGELLVAPELKIDIQKEGDLVRYNNQITGKLNGGSETNIDIRSDHNKIYLRKK